MSYFKVMPTCCFLIIYKFLTFHVLYNSIIDESTLWKLPKHIGGRTGPAGPALAVPLFGLISNADNQKFAYVQIIDPCWRSMFKSNRSFMSISKRGSELCSQLVINIILVAPLFTADLK